MRSASLLVVKGLLFASMLVAFFAMTPWLGCKPLSAMPSSRDTKIEASRDAVCFTDNHGRIAFHRHGLIDQEPVRFAAHLLALLLPAALLFYLRRGSPRAVSSESE